MAIYITDKDGNDQHFDTIEEFERAMIFMARLGGGKPPQDLIDEVKERDSEALEKEILTDFIVGKAKDGGMHEIVLAQGEPIKFFGDGEVDDEESDDDKISVRDSNSEEREFKFKVGDKVRVVDNSTLGLEEGTVGTVFEIDTKDKDIPYNVKAEDGYFHHRESDLELVEVDKEEVEYHAGDIVYVTETIKHPYFKHAIQKGLAEIKNGSMFEDSLIYQEGVALNFKTDNIDHRDKVRLVCRVEDRKDKEYGDK